MEHQDPANVVGRELRVVRHWRKKSLRVVAGLSGLSYGYLGKIERGEKPLTDRATVEALCRALEIAPSELTGRPWEVSNGPGERAHAGVVALEAALDEYELGEDPGGPVREWPAVSADLDRLADLVQAADYASQGELAPGLLRELHAAHVRHPELRRPVLLGLIRAYSSAVWVTKRLGGRGLSLLAARAAQQVADELEDPAWRGYTTWLRGDATGALSRPTQYARAVRVADELTPHLDDPQVVQAYGMLHLSAALAQAVQRRPDEAQQHLAEASAIADRMDDEVGTFGNMWFGRPNVAIWSATLWNELGLGGEVAARLRGVRVDAIPSVSRRAEYLCEIGRSLLTERATRDQGVAVLSRAEKLAPQRVRADVLVREAVADQLRTAWRDAGGRELRGLAWRLGLAPEGYPTE